MIYLLAHVEQQAIVNIVDTKHGNHDGGIDNDIFVALHIFKQENQADNRNNHD